MCIIVEPKFQPHNTTEPNILLPQEINWRLDFRFFPTFINTAETFTLFCITLVQNKIVRKISKSHDVLF